MSEIDHRAEALRLLAVADDRHADGDPEGGAIFTAQAQVHATLAATQPAPAPADDPYWAQAKELEELRKHARAVTNQARGVVGEDNMTVSHVLVPKVLVDVLRVLLDRDV
jgi:hypothetical protein